MADMGLDLVGSQDGRAPQVTLEQERRAVLAVAALARDVADARLLLDMLGLDPSVAAVRCR